MSNPKTHPVGILPRAIKLPFPAPAYPRHSSQPIVQDPLLLTFRILRPVRERLVMQIMKPLYSSAFWFMIGPVGILACLLSCRVSRSLSRCINMSILPSNSSTRLDSLYIVWVLKGPICWLSQSHVMRGNISSRIY